MARLTQSIFTNKQLAALKNEADDQYERMRGGRFYRNVDFLLYVLSVILVAFAIRTFLAEPIRVDGDSMVPTLLNDEHMFVEKVSYWFRPPERGEIIICFYPGYSESCVKRVVGLPGEEVAVKDGRVYIDGEALNESSYFDETMLSGDETFEVGEDELFVMGDNRNGSKDSRSSSVGPIPYQKVLGRVRSVIWPIGDYHAIPGVQY